MNENKELLAIFSRSIWVSALDTSVELSDEERRQKWLEERAVFSRLAKKTLNYLHQKGYVLTEIDKVTQEN